MSDSNEISGHSMAVAALTAARAAVATSQRESRTVTIPYDVDVYEWLIAWCEDSADAPFHLEVWGEDEGGEWRVHLEVGNGGK